MHWIVFQPSELAAATAASYGVPIIMASGDDVLCADIARQLGPHVETACTKTALSFHAASCLLPAEALAEVRGAAERSMRRLLQQVRVSPESLCMLSPIYILLHTSRCIVCCRDRAALVWRAPGSFATLCVASQSQLTFP